MSRISIHKDDSKNEVTGEVYRKAETEFYQTHTVLSEDSNKLINESILLIYKNRR